MVSGFGDLDFKAQGILGGIIWGYERVFLRWTPHPAIVTIRDNRDYIRALVYSYYTTITGWGVLLRYAGMVDTQMDKKVANDIKIGLEDGVR